MRNLTIGIASYGSPEKLAATIESIERQTVGDYRLVVWHNKGKDNDACIEVIARASDQNDCITARFSDNVGYAGAVNGLLAACETDYFLYCDNDIEILTPGWDEKFCEILDAHPEVAQVFPGAGHYGFNNGRYHECLWSAGYCWAFRSTIIDQCHFMGAITPFDPLMDTQLGHHEEVDLMIRLRLAGYQIACRPDVQVLHHETSTQSPESAKRIHAGVVRWMCKWLRYFYGDAFIYPNPDPDSGETYDPRSTRFTDWPPISLYLERMTLHYFPDWNSAPREVQVPGVGIMDAVEVLKPHGYYKGRAL